VSLLSLVHFTRHLENRGIKYGWLNGRTGDEQTHTIGMQSGSVYDDWMKDSPQETSLHILDVNGSSCPVYTIFQRPGCGSGGVIHINDALGNMK
jgi:hypothetical protein